MTKKLSPSLLSFLLPASLSQTQNIGGTKSFQKASHSRPILTRFSLIAFCFQASQPSPAIPPSRDQARSAHPIDLPRPTSQMQTPLWDFCRPFRMHALESKSHFSILVIIMWSGQLTLGAGEDKPEARPRLGCRRDASDFSASSQQHTAPCKL